MYLQSLQPFAVGVHEPGPLCGNRDEVTHCPFLTCPRLGWDVWPPLLSPESPDQRQALGAPTLQLLFCLLEPKLRVRLKDTARGGRHTVTQSPDLNLALTSAPNLSSLTIASDLSSTP